MEFRLQPVRTLPCREDFHAWWRTEAHENFCEELKGRRNERDQLQERYRYRLRPRRAVDKSRELVAAWSGAPDQVVRPTPHMLKAALEDTSLMSALVATVAGIGIGHALNANEHTTTQPVRAE
jgi:hypothetical protein